MNWIDLGNPVPRQEAHTCAPVSWPAGMVWPFPQLPDRPAISFDKVRLRRRSGRTFLTPTDGQLGELLGLTCRVQFTISDIYGFPQTHRPPPSAGAIHPVNVIVHTAGEPSWARYDPFDHALVELPARIAPPTVRIAMEEVLPAGGATLLLFAAQPALTFAKYEHACSLVWRDAGVLQGYLSMAAESLGLNFCLIGVTGEPWVSRLIDEGALVGVGAAYVGAP
jgi:hypothetical protein